MSDVVGVRRGFCAPLARSVGPRGASSPLSAARGMVPVPGIAAASGRRRATVHRGIAQSRWHDAEGPNAAGRRPRRTSRATTPCPGRARAPPRAVRRGGPPLAGRLFFGGDLRAVARRARAAAPAVPRDASRFVYGPAGRSEEPARHPPLRQRPRVAGAPRSPVFPDRGTSGIALRPRAAAPDGFSPRPPRPLHSVTASRGRHGPLALDMTLCMTLCVGGDVVGRGASAVTIALVGAGGSPGAARRGPRRP